MIPTDAAPRVVYDCMIFLQGLIQQAGPAVECLELFERGEVRLCVNGPVLVEIRDVLTRPKLQRKFTRLTLDRVELLLQRLHEKAEFFEGVTGRAPYCRDPKDEPYLNLAVSAGADYLVSRDNDLLDLMGEANTEFRSEFPQLTILNPVAFLHHLRAV